MLFGKTGIPVRLIYDIADFSTTRGVQGEVSRKGTASGGSVVIETVNLTINSSITGRYEALYTPTTTEDSLDIRFIVYNTTSYSTRALGYSVITEQLVLNSGVGQLGGSAGVAGGGFRHLTDKELERIAELLSKKIDNKPKKDTTKGIIEVIKDFHDKSRLDAKKSISLLETQSANLSKLDKLEDLDKLGSLDKLKNLNKLNSLNKLSKLELLEEIKNKRDTLTEEDFKILLKIVKEFGDQFNKEQNIILTSFLNDKIFRILLDVITNNSGEIDKKLEIIMAHTVGKDSKELNKLNKTVTIFNIQMKKLRKELIPKNDKKK